MDYRLGLVVFASNNGLSNQTKALYDHLKPHKTLLVDISEFNHQPIYPERFHDAQICKGFPNIADIQRFLQDIDVLFVCETPLNYDLFRIARQNRVKTVLQLNWEFLDYLQNKTLPFPDVLLAPSKWHYKDLQQFNNRAIIKYLPFPVDRELLPRRKYTQARTFVHIAGQKLYEDRNGTEIVLAAIPYVKSPTARFIIYSQHKLEHQINDPRVEIREGDLPNYQDLYREGEVLLLPRRYGGQSLQLNEALSAGMLALMPNVSPQDEILPKELLILPHTSKNIMTRTMIQCYSIDPDELARKIDYLVTSNPGTIYYLSETCNTIADNISWETLKPQYEKLFKELV